jgi:N-6 DNA Methylase
MLRLRTGIFYAQGVKANVLFDKRPAVERPWTERLWSYDLRTNQHFTLKQNPLRRHHFEEFAAWYLPGEPRSERVESERLKSVGYDELIARDARPLGPRQGQPRRQPRHHLAVRRVAGGYAEPPGTRGDRPRDRGRPQSSRRSPPPWKLLRHRPPRHHRPRSDALLT